MSDVLDTAADRGIGHNQPPPDPLDRADSLVDNANRWIAERPEITDAEMAGIAQDFVTQLRQNRDDLEAASAAARKPHDLAVAAIRIRYRKPLELIGIAMTKMSERLGPWLTRERNRLDAEAAARKQAIADAAAQAEALRKAAEQSGTVEAELAARDAEKAQAGAVKAAAKPVARARVRGELSPRAMTLKRTYYAVVVNETEALRSFAKSPTVREVALAEALRLSTNLAKACKGDPSRCPKGFEFKFKESPI